VIIVSTNRDFKTLSRLLWEECSQKPEALAVNGPVSARGGDIGVPPRCIVGDKLAMRPEFALKELCVPAPEVARFRSRIAPSGCPSSSCMFRRVTTDNADIRLLRRLERTTSMSSRKWPLAGGDAWSVGSAKADVTASRTGNGVKLHICIEAM
jgi:hypothetical protein